VIDDDGMCVFVYNVEWMRMRWGMRCDAMQPRGLQGRGRTEGRDERERLGTARDDRMKWAYEKRLVGG
jgi:hypothetical protein